MDPLGKGGRPKGGKGGGGGGWAGGSAGGGGKGADGTISGNCWYCGEYGHRQNACPSLDQRNAQRDAAGKGAKGGDKGGGKGFKGGKGYGKGKGKGKGLYEFGGWDGYDDYGGHSTYGGFNGGYDDYGAYGAGGDSQAAVGAAPAEQVPAAAAQAWTMGPKSLAVLAMPHPRAMRPSFAHPNPFEPFADEDEEEAPPELVYSEGEDEFPPPGLPAKPVRVCAGDCCGVPKVRGSASKRKPRTRREYLTAVPELPEGQEEQEEPADGASMLPRSLRPL